ncbi:MAG TPA: biotin transporter BioY [Gemmatimonadaceae bacterium]|nr:biotin transporter BioY [Gemmatimonadaceae bacterium]
MTSHILALPRDRRVALAGVVGFAAALAAASQVAVPVPGTPVPFTLQPLVVVLAGLWLGPVWGAASMLLYVAAGAAGLPVFAPTLPTVGLARLLGPTGGYILAYPVAAWLTGAIAARREGFAWRVLAAVAGIAMLHLGGIAQLVALTGSATRAVVLGSLPFAAFDVVKAVVAGGLSPRRRARD